MNVAKVPRMKNPIRIVFVEDDPEMMALYAENFLMPEFQIMSASDGQQALDLLRGPSEHFDVLVADNHMTQIDAMKLLRVIRQEFPEIKFLMLAGYGNWSDYIESQNFGIYKFFKPVKMSDLKQLIRKIA